MEHVEDIRARNRQPATAPAQVMQQSSIPPRKAKPKPTIRESYDRYKAGRMGMGRADLFGVMVDAIEELQDRIGSVDEKAVSDISARVRSLEMVIGNALASNAPAETKRGPGRPPKKVEANNG